MGLIDEERQFDESIDNSETFNKYLKDDEQLKVGDRIKLKMFESEIETTIDEIVLNGDKPNSESQVYYFLDDAQYFSPFSSIHQDIDGWYTLEIYRVGP